MLLNKIIDLINSKSEGEYWDFKEKPYENNAALLHDILCLSNCLYEGERYLIIGLTDPSSGCQLIGLEKNQANRKNQVSYIDFLRSIKFAGDNRPVLELKTLNLNGSEIDVLVIQNLPLKPYYITTSYRDKDKEVKANHIYSRTQDTNTPIDKSADINQIEKMWYQRFGLDLTPVVKMQRYLLDPNQWTKNIGNSRLIFHNTFPEYTIELSEVEKFWEVYSYFFTNEKSFLGTAKFKCHQTELFELEYMYCDEMRIILPVPQSAYLRVDGEDNWYYYYDRSSNDGLFLHFLTDGNYNLVSRGTGAPFLLFNDQDARNDFNQYVLDNSTGLENIEPTFWGQHALKRMTQTGNESVIDPLFLDRIYQLYQAWILKNI
ncbi:MULTISPECIES: RNA-binding domain-containing protein [Sphingobacterium]|uniref:RNA-binding domain-containing protein n=1 Tax=Sphingobacterium TaxID=28453 RepID=UPI00257FACFE|nr:MULTISPECIES: RNA-binding domain-containing protein [Sphingobacterium]